MLLAFRERRNMCASSSQSEMPGKKLMKNADEVEMTADNPGGW
jgi:hypothetical protein